MRHSNTRIPVSWTVTYKFFSPSIASIGQCFNIFSQHHHFNFVYMEFFNAKQYFSLTIHFAQHMLHFDFWIEENIHTLTVHGCHSFQFYFATIRKIIFAHLNILLNPVPTINEMQLSVFFLIILKVIRFTVVVQSLFWKRIAVAMRIRRLKISMCFGLILLWVLESHISWEHTHTHTLPILIGFQEITTSQAGGFIFLLPYVCHVHTKICMW